MSRPVYVSYGRGCTGLREPLPLSRAPYAQIDAHCLGCRASVLREKVQRKFVKPSS